ncbi:uncharacterized protein FYW61_006884 [Anableps anableps]
MLPTSESGSCGLLLVSLTAVAAGVHLLVLRDRLRPPSSSGSCPTGLGPDSGSGDPRSPPPVPVSSSALSQRGSVAGCWEAAEPEQPAAAAADLLVKLRGRIPPAATRRTPDSRKTRRGDDERPSSGSSEEGGRRGKMPLYVCVYVEFELCILRMFDLKVAFSTCF